MDGIVMLKDDHKTVDALFKKFERRRTRPARPRSASSWIR